MAVKEFGIKRTAEGAMLCEACGSNLKGGGAQFVERVDDEKGTLNVFYCCSCGARIEQFIERKAEYIGSTDEMTIGERVNLARKKRRLKWKQLAELTGVSKSTMQYWLYGGNDPHISALIRVADALNVSLDELVGRKKRQ
jgi:DNA-binding XRE family transcriptional regulator